jgi:hypothetical protein
MHKPDQTLALATLAGFNTIHVLPHLNTIEGRLGNRALWRNVVPFSPLAKAPVNDSAGSFSYSDVLLQPAAEAINSVANNDTFVEFALTGEQGLSTWTYPREYLQLLHEMKNITLRCVIWGVIMSHDMYMLPSLPCSLIPKHPP